jgi:hypothetical protein
MVLNHMFDGPVEKSSTVVSKTNLVRLRFSKCCSVSDL